MARRRPPLLVRPLPCCRGTGARLLLLLLLLGGVALIAGGVGVLLLASRAADGRQGRRRTHASMAAAAFTTLHGRRLSRRTAAVPCMTPARACLFAAKRASGAA